MTGYISKSELICPIPKEGYNEKTIVNIAPAVAETSRTKRVAAYARVSCGKDTMLHSLAAQIDYYRDYIMMNPEWRFAGVYADESKTGTKDNREQFQVLLSECRSGNIDMVITKSISRLRGTRSRFLKLCVNSKASVLMFSLKNRTFTL